MRKITDLILLSQLSVFPSAATAEISTRPRPESTEIKIYGEIEPETLATPFF